MMQDAELPGRRARVHADRRPPAPRRVPRAARRRAAPSSSSATTPPHVELAACTTPEPGDVGMHFLCAPTDTPVHGFTRAVITAVMDVLFADPAHPAGRRRAGRAQHRRARAERGRRLRASTATIAKPEKDALLSFCTRDQFLEPPRRPRRRRPMTPSTALAPRRRRPPHPRALGARQPAPDPQGARRVRPRAAAHARTADRRDGRYVGHAATTARPEYRFTARPSRPRPLAGRRRQHHPAPRRRANCPWTPWTSSSSCAAPSA